MSTAARLQPVISVLAMAIWSSSTPDVRTSSSRDYNALIRTNAAAPPRLDKRVNTPMSESFARFVTKAILTILIDDD